MDADLNSITERVIGAAFAVSNQLGCGFLESVYEASLAIELAAGGLSVCRQKSFDVLYRGCQVGHYVADLVVEGCIVVEVKALTRLAPEHEAQVLNYLKASGLSLGLLINFGTPRVQIRRLVRSPISVDLRSSAD